MANVSESAGRVLVADDEPDVVKAVRLLLKGEGYITESASSAKGILEALDARSFDAVLMDLNYTRGTTSGKEGLDLLARMRELDSTLPVVVMTAWSSVELAVEAMRRGARDFVPKPWKNERLLSILRTQIDLGRALRATRRLEEENRALREAVPHRLITRAPAMQPVLELINRSGPSDANVLVTGENGAGKSLVAHILHEASQRATKPMVTLNIGGLPASLFESELFGHVRGAFTGADADRIGRFELADGGTLFLDEIADIPIGLQSRLLRVLETGEFERVGSSKTRRADVRVLSATNARIEDEVREGRFRQDLLFRLNTVEIPLPPLRQRREDIPALAQHFLGCHAEHYRRPVSSVAPAAIEVLLEYSWPGNIRELDHTIERAVLMAQNDIIEVGDLGLGSRAAQERPFEEMTLDEAERALIQRAIDRCGGNMKKAARALGLSRSALYRRLEKHGL